MAATGKIRQTALAARLFNQFFNPDRLKSGRRVSGLLFLGTTKIQVKYSDIS